jgi:hypothetical protein
LQNFHYFLNPRIAHMLGCLSRVAHDRLQNGQKAGIVE